MRMRFKPYAGPELAACPFHMNDATQYRGRWRETFARPAQPLHLELGCGKGGFLAELASRHPEVNYIGVDITDKVLVLAKRNIERVYAQKGMSIDNVKTLAHDIERIPTLLSAADRVERIYINFCNPWNKKANHKKHRLTHTRQLMLYRPFLAENAELWFKCDDEDLFCDTLRYLPEAGFAVIWQTRDLHADEPAWNIRTEHERMFTEMGIPTKALIARITALQNAPAGASGLTAAGAQADPAAADVQKTGMAAADAKTDAAAAGAKTDAAAAGAKTDASAAAPDEVRAVFSDGARGF